MIALALLTVLAAQPPHVALVKRSSAGIDNAVTAVVMRAVSDALLEDGLTASLEDLRCPGDAACLASVAQGSSAVATVALTLVRGRKQLTVDLEAVDEAERALGVVTFTVPLLGAPLPLEGTQFLKRVADALLAAHQAADAPKLQQLEPVARPPPVAAVEVRARSSSGSAGLKVAGGSAIVLGAATVGVLIAAMVVKSGLEGQLARQPLPLTRVEAEQQASLANGLFTATVIAGGLTTAATVTTGVLWLKGPADEK